MQKIDTQKIFCLLLNALNIHSLIGTKVFDNELKVTVLMVAKVLGVVL